jgi:citrate synthase
VHTDVGPGLDGVIAAETRVAWLDPSSGLLHYRGVPVERLAGKYTFEQVVHLLLTGHAPEDDLERFEQTLEEVHSARQLPDDVLQLLRATPPSVHPTRTVRAVMSALGCHQMTVDDDLTGDRHWHDLRIVSQMAAVVAEVARHRRGVGASSPRQVDTTTTLAADVLCALNGRSPGADEIEALDLLWTVMADHGLDGPTFTSMVVASCLADPYTNLVAGLSALCGPRLGGAGETVLHQLTRLDDVDEARTWVGTAISSRTRIAGFGHRLYRMPDPRAVPLRKCAALLARSTGREQLFEIARTVEDEATRRLATKGVHINANFYTALVLSMLGADPPMVPCLLMVGRMAGLVARVREALETIRLYRPISRYVGLASRLVIPLENR